MAVIRHNRLSMSELIPVPQPSADPEIAERLDDHAHRARGALSPNTLRALRADSAIFTAWCVTHRLPSLPATEDSLAAFVDAMADTRAPATVRRYVASVGALHRAAGLPDPAATPAVRLALRRVGRQRGVRQTQAAPLNRAAVDQMLARRGENRIDRRDAALLSVAYDSLARRGELVALTVQDVQFAEDGTATVLIRRSKTDADGAGAIRFLAPDTVHALTEWLTGAAVTDGALFRSVTKGNRVGSGIDVGDIARVFRKLARRASLDPSRISGHSTRVGAAQDMIAHGLEIGEVMQAGGWKTPVMVARYAERLTARRGAAAKLAMIQRRWHRSLD
jgi:integrase